MFGKAPFLIGFPALLVGGAVLASFAYLNDKPSVSAEHLPGLYLDHVEHDFGEVPQGSVLKAEFVLTNRYKSAIEVTKVAGGCSCQDVAIDKAQLQAGDTARITVTWKVAAARHRIREHVLITHTLSGEEKREPLQVRVSVTAEVKPDVEVAPEQLTFDAGTPGKAAIQLSPGTQPVFEIRRISSAAAFLKFTTDHSTKSIVVEYDPTSADASEIKAVIIVETNSVNQSLLNIPVTIQIPTPKASIGAYR